MQLAIDAEGADPVEEKVQTARTAYERSVEQLQAAVRAFMEKEIASAQSAGEADKLAMLERELSRFESSEVVPSTAPKSLHEDQVAAVRRFVDVANAAIKAYTRAGDKAVVQLIEAERDKVAAVGTKAIVRTQLVGVWNLNSVNYSTSFILKPDGKMTHTTARLEMDWEVDVEKGIVLCTCPGHGTETIQLPINPRGTRGFGRQGNRWTIKKVK